MAITPAVMSNMKMLEKFDHEVVILEDSQMQSPKAITEVMLKVEQQGADASPANPDVIEACRDADIVVVHVSPINAAVLEQAQNLKYVAVMRSGVENVNIDICKARGIHVINAPGRSAHAVADCTLALMLAEAKNIARGHKGLMEGKWIKQFANFNYTHDIRNCTMGIIGAGDIGRKVIDRLKGFGANIIVHDPYLADDVLEGMGLTPVTMDELLVQSDFISLHLRLSETTEKFFGTREFELMKDTAYFINTARSGLVDEAALVDALQNKRIGGAALDVFNEEPLGDKSPFLELDNVTITPHLSGTSTDTFANSVELIRDDLINMLENKKIAGLLF
jgi:D-3-phosphoglycerate dehydrogenase